MRRIILAALTLALIAVPAAAQEPPAPPKGQGAPAPADIEGLEGGIYARIDTDKGAMVLRLHYDKAPLTVANFVGLARGLIPWVNPRTRKKVEKAPFYKGKSFHRIIKGFMIQGGCPLGNGQGNPGYRFSDEIRPELKHDAAGVLAMANSGPGTNGCQFYITLAPQPKLDGRYTVFGKLVKGQDTLEAIGAVPTGAGDAPTSPVVIKDVTIHRVGEAAEKWNLFEAGRGALSAKLPQGEPGPADPAKLPNLEAEELPGAGIEMLVVSYRGAQGTIDLIPYSRREAQALAKRIAAFAREKDRDFTELVAGCPNFRSGSAAFDRSLSRTIPSFLKNIIFHLRPGQVTEPIETPGGWLVARAAPTLSLRIVGTRKPENADPKGTKAINQQRAADRARAEKLRAALVGGEAFEKVLGRSEVRLGKDGYIGTYLRQRAAEIFESRLGPEFVEEVLKLEPGQVSPVLETPAGHLVVQRKD